MKKLVLEIAGEKVEVLAQKMGGQLWLHLNGKTFSYTPTSENAVSGGGAHSLDPTQIVAPMPGKIIKILKQEKDRVAEGDTIIVMEAMKMEYNLKADQSMVIKKLSCQEGQSVSLGEKLVEMEEV